MSLDEESQTIVTALKFCFDNQIGTLPYEPVTDSNDFDIERRVAEIENRKFRKHQNRERNSSFNTESELQRKRE